MIKDYIKFKNLILFVRDNWREAFWTSSVAVAVISLALIAARLGPISGQANGWNRCVKTTSGFLKTLPELGSIDSDGLEAMSVALCNGSNTSKDES